MFYSSLAPNSTQPPKIGILEALARIASPVDDPAWRLWDPTDPVNGYVCGVLAATERCGSPAIRTDKLKHRFRRGSWRCHSSLCPNCMTKLMTLVNTISKPTFSPPGHVVGDPAAVKDAHHLLSGPGELVRVSLPVSWPWTASHLESRAVTLRRTVAYRGSRWQNGAVVGLRLEPDVGAIAAYCLRPVGSVAPPRGKTSRRGRPSPASVKVLAQSGNGHVIVDQWLRVAGGGWVTEVPDDKDTITAVYSLIQWLLGKRDPYSGWEFLGTTWRNWGFDHSVPSASRQVDQRGISTQIFMKKYIRQFGEPQLLLSSTKLRKYGE